jgi:dTDP-L-rhamnose 4-epimerase
LVSSKFGSLGAFIKLFKQKSIKFIKPTGVFKLMEKALVTGGAGLIGSHIVDLLLQKGYEVKVLDNLEKETHPFGKPHWIPGSVEFIKGDMKNLRKVKKAVKGVNYIFHQAAYGGFSPDDKKYVMSNSVGIVNLFNAIKATRAPIKKVITASSQGVYGEGRYSCPEHGVFHPSNRPQKQLELSEWEVKCPICSKLAEPKPVDEEKPIDPGITYSMTKYTQERYTIKTGEKLGIPSVALRYSMTYGPRQSLFNPYTGVTSVFSTLLLNDKQPTVYEDGHQKRDFVFVGDVANANIAVSESEEANHQVFNVGTGTPTTVLQYIDILKKAYNKEHIKSNIPNQFRPGEVRHLFSDSTKLRSIGWEPKVTVAEGVNNYVKWIRRQGEVKDYFTKAKEWMDKQRIVVQSGNK